MQNRSTRYKYILWDHDGVLVDTERWYFAATRRALSEMDVVLDEATYLTFMAQGISCWGLAGKRGFSDQDIQIKKQTRNGYYQAFLEREQIEINGVLPVLEELSQSYRMGIVTTSRRVDFELIHRERTITSYMEFVLTVEDYAKAKPDPAPYLAGLAQFNAQASEAIAVEDTSRGLRSAAAANIDCIVIATPFTRTQDFSLAKQVIGSIEELPGVLAALNEGN